MSLMLKGIDLPSENNSIIVEIFPSGECSTMEIEKGECYEFCLNGNTEAIQIPKGHGRLIDADKFIEDLKYDVEMDRTRYITDGDEEAREDAECKENCISFIESSATPKILEAEENDESNTERD